MNVFSKGLESPFEFKGYYSEFWWRCANRFTDPVFEQNVIFDIRLQSLLKGRLCIYVAVKSAL